MNNIYFDHSATTPLDSKVLSEMQPYFNKIYGNASSIHTFGQEASSGIEKARSQIANFLNCSSDEVYFTSGATESNNIAVLGYLKALVKKKNKNIHVITSVIEHDAILEPFKQLEESRLKVTYLPVDKSAVIDLEKLKRSITDDTCFLSVMYVNSEIGSIQPIREIGKIVKKVNADRIKKWQNTRVRDRGDKPLPLIFHTDATQALNFLDCNTKRLHVDMMSFSGHKIYGPKGVGGLYINSNVRVEPIIIGGHQEKNIRSGTYNVPGIVGLGSAISQLTDSGKQRNNEKISRLRNILIAGIKKNIPNSILNTNTKKATPSHAHFTFIGAEGEAILIALDLEGIAVSTGSACASGSLQASHVLVAMGIKKEVAHNSIRFTLGKKNTEADVKRLIKVLPGIIKRLRDFNPLYNE